MQETKWADVANMYVNSNVQSVHNGELVFLAECRDGTHLWQYEDHALHDFPIEGIDGLPFLRHRDDMTEDEAREYYQLCPQEWAVFYKTAPNSKLKEAISSLRRRTPTEFLWLISHGFDVFGLIESGQAIRSGGLDGQ